ncbi:MAG: sensor domain-containing phosphodiesterase [Phycisphaeraceae bacterium]
MKPPVHPKEEERLASLYNHEILDTGADQSFNDLAQLAAQLCDVPVALVSLIDRDRQWFKARLGLELEQTNRDVSFCAHAICEDGTLVVEDATQDERFRDNPLVTPDNGIRFYAGAKVCDEDGLPLGTLCLIDHQPHTFSEDKRRQLEQLAKQAGHQLTLHRLLLTMSNASQRDPLTGLRNRRGLIAAMHKYKLKPNQIQAVIYLDLQRFKPINDSFGHAIGDDILRQVAERLRNAIDRCVCVANQTQAILSRIGGDEFVVSVHTRHDEQWVQRVLAEAMVQSLVEPFEADGQSFHLGSVAGVAASLPGQRLAASEAISNADIAMCKAKIKGRSVMRFDQVMRDQLEHEMEIESALRRAVKAGGVITAAFEPIMNLHTGKVLGFEALARWTDPVIGRVRPDQFIPIAERTGLIDQVFHAVASQALRVCKSLDDESQQNLFFSVNLSKTQLNDDRLFKQLADLTTEYGVPASRLHLEVTESLVTSSDDMIDKLHRLRKIGHPLMLDDFGTGTSSLSCLQAYPVQWIKIDRELTDAADKSRNYAAIVQSVADLASNLGMQLIAEGVEAVETIPLLQGMDVGAAQGWYWSKPLEPGHVGEWLERRDAERLSLADVA